MRKYGIPSAAYVGDIEGDRLAAEKAGIDFIWAAYGFGSVEHYAQRLDTPADLIRLDKEGLL